MDHDGTLQPGTNFGQYRFVRLLGRGGMGEVYEVDHLTLGSRFALKVMQGDIMKLPEAMERFRREARAMHRLSHPNILRVDDFGETDGHVWLRMELATGLELTNDLRAISMQDAIRLYREGEGGLPKGPIPEDIATEWIRQLLAGLAFAHDYPDGGVVHRDIKPANLLFIGETLKISDFGLVHLAGDEWLNTQMQKGLTMMGGRRFDLDDAATMPVVTTGHTGGTGASGTTAMLGTYEYMAPEARAGNLEADARGDLYAVGKIAFQLLTGRREIGRKSVTQLAPGLNPGWDAWLDRALEENPADRFQSAAEMLAAVPDGSAVNKAAKPAVATKRPAKSDKATKAQERPAKTARPATARPRFKMPGMPFLLGALSIFIVLATFVTVLLPLFLSNGVQNTEEPSATVQTRTTQAHAPTPAGLERTDAPTGSPESDTATAQTASDDTENVAAGGSTEPDPVVELQPVAPDPAFRLSIKPVTAEALVWIGSASQKSVRNGTLELKGIQPGRQRLRVEAVGFEPVNRFVEIGEDGSAEETVVLKPVFGRLRVEGPVGALVEAVTGDKVVGVGSIPSSGVLVSTDLLTAGTYTIKLTKPGFEPFTANNIRLRGDITFTLQSPMKALPGSVSVFSRPSGASVFVDDKLLGRTPLVVDPLEAGRQWVFELRLEGYASEQRTVTVGPNQSIDLDFGLLNPAVGRARINLAGSFEVDEASLTVLVNGSPAEFSFDRDERSLLIDGLSEGQLTVQVEHPGRQRWQEPIDVIAGDDAVASATLPPLAGRLAINLASASGAPLTAQDLEGAVLSPPGLQPLPVTAARSSFEFPPADAFEVKLEAPGFETVSRTVTIEGGAETVLNILLEPVRGDIRSVTLSDGLKMDFVWVDAINLWVGRFEVTNAQFRLGFPRHDSGRYSDFSLNQPNQPAVEVTYEQAEEYCEWLTRMFRNDAGGRFRLPSGNEWTAIAKAGDGRGYPWGDSMPPSWGNYSDNAARAIFNSWSVLSSYDDGHPVSADVDASGSNPLGLFGVGGNVWEWTSELGAGRSRTVRGGSWMDYNSSDLRCDAWNTEEPSARAENIGFRVVLDAPQ